jgi:hypothetical protein
MWRKEERETEENHMVNGLFQKPKTTAAFPYKLMGGIYINSHPTFSVKYLFLGDKRRCSDEWR